MDEWGAAALCQEMAASPTPVATTSSTIAYGTFPGNSITTADAVKAYVQAHLKSEHPTWSPFLLNFGPTGGRKKVTRDQ